MGQQLFSAIIVNEIQEGKFQFIKYRNVPKNKFRKLFEYSIKTFPGVHHINLYEKATKRFFKQYTRAEIEQEV